MHLTKNKPTNVMQESFMLIKMLTHFDILPGLIIF